MDLLWTHSFSLHKKLIDGLELCGLLVDYCDVFISCLDSHSDGTHSLQWIHWWASDIMLNSSKSVPMKKQTHLHLIWPEMSTFSVNIHFWLNYSCKRPTKLILIFRFTISIRIIVPSPFFPPRLAEGLYWDVHGIFYRCWKFPCVRYVSYNDSSLFLVLYGPSTPITFKEVVSGWIHWRWTSQTNSVLKFCAWDILSLGWYTLLG